MPRMREVKCWDTRFPPPGRGGVPLCRKVPLLREQPIKHVPDWDVLERIIRRDTCGGLGGTIEDVIERRSIVIKVDGVVVAAVRLLLYVAFDLDGNTQLSDGIGVTIYRNPKSPRHFKATF